MFPLTKITTPHYLNSKLLFSLCRQQQHAAVPAAAAYRDEDAYFDASDVKPADGDGEGGEGKGDKVEANLD